MSSLRAFKQKLATISRLREKKQYDAALSEIEDALKVWPGNAHLHLLWAGLVQLQENPKHSLDEAKQALQRASELDKSSAAGAIELGYFLDNVDDNPAAASRAFSEGVTAARQLLIDGLIGQAKACLQLNKRKDARRCLLEVLHLMDFEPGARRGKTRETDPIEELLSDVIASRSA